MYNSREKGTKSGDLALVWIGADRGRVATEINGLELCGINPRILGCFRCVRRRNKTYNKKTISFELWEICRSRRPPTFCFKGPCVEAN